MSEIWRHALVERGHQVEVATIAVAGPAGTSLDGDVTVHRIRTTAQHLPRLYSDPERPHAMPVVDPGFRSAIGQLLGTRRFDILHAHDWSIGSAIGPARRAGIPVVLTQHDYSHVCATKRLMRGDVVCPGPTPLACVRCASSWHGPVVGPVVVAANALSRRSRSKTCGCVRPGQFWQSPSAPNCPDGARIGSFPTSFPTISSSTRPPLAPTGPSCSSET